MKEAETLDGVGLIELKTLDSSLLRQGAANFFDFGIYTPKWAARSRSGIRIAPGRGSTGEPFQELEELRNL